MSSYPTMSNNLHSSGPYIHDTETTHKNKNSLINITTSYKSKQNITRRDTRNSGYQRLTGTQIFSQGNSEEN